MIKILFIPKRVIILLHEELIDRYGGSSGIRDEKLLDSALAQPQVTFGEIYLHDSIYKMAAAYGYHLCCNHPFVDGNKRIALVSMDIFLQRNGYELTANEKEAYRTIMKLSQGQLSKDELTNWIKKNSNAI